MTGFVQMGHNSSKLTLFWETLDPWLKYRVFLCVNDTMNLVNKMDNKLEQ